MPRALPKPYADLGRARSRLQFFHGDAIEILKIFRAGSIDAVVTSPPYNLGIRYPFLGLGSSAVACAKLGIDFVGIELDEHYLREAVERTKHALTDGAEGAAHDRRLVRRSAKREGGSRSPVRRTK